MKTSASDKPFGIKGKLENYPFPDHQETFVDSNGIQIQIDNGILVVGVDQKSKLEDAIETAKLHLAASNLRQNTRARVDFNHRWDADDKGKKLHQQYLAGSLQPIGSVTITRTNEVSITGLSFIVTEEMHNNKSFLNDTEMVRKASQNPILKTALEFYNDEVAPGDRPLYGIYKAIEAITHHLNPDGRTNLANLAGKTKKYVSAVMETANEFRHAPGGPARPLLDEKECRDRARVLIDAFANSLP